MHESVAWPRCEGESRKLNGEMEGKMVEEMAVAEEGGREGWKVFFFFSGRGNEGEREK